MSEFTIYHNPRCSKSRATLALLQENGIDPDIVLYLQQAPAHETLRELISLLGIAPRDLIRTGEKEYAEHGLANPDLTDDELIEALHQFPILMQRPIVVANGKARIGRPPESVTEII